MRTLLLFPFALLRQFMTQACSAPPDSSPECIRWVFNGQIVLDSCQRHSDGQARKVALMGPSSLKPGAGQRLGSTVVQL